MKHLTVIIAVYFCLLSPFASGGGLPVTHVIMQHDGNFVAYNADSASWDSGTWGHPGSVLVVQDDGNMVVYAPGGNAVWNSHTPVNPVL